jgi:hypothetical protein
VLCAQVLITRTNPLHEKPIEGVVLDKSKSRLQVVVKDYPPNITEGTWVPRKTVAFALSCFSRPARARVN